MSKRTEFDMSSEAIAGRLKETGELGDLWIRLRRAECLGSVNAKHSAQGDGHPGRTTEWRMSLSDWEEREEWVEWALKTPEERFIESAKLWQTYLALGGSLDPEPDSESPFDFPELQRAVSPDGRSGVHFIRRGGFQS